MSAARLFCCAVLLGGCGAGRPTANAGPVERNAKAREVLTFDASASRGVIDSYTWDFGDGSATEEGKVVTHAFLADGNFSVSLTVKGPGGQHSTSVAVNVGGGCNATAAITVATTNPQPGAPVVLNGAASKGCNGASISSYAWDFGDGATEAGDASRSSVTHTWAAQGVYTVTLLVKDSNGAEGRATRSLGVGAAVGNPSVTCPATAAATVGAPASFSASGTDPGGKALTYGWTFSDGGSASGASVQHTFSQAGSFTAQVVATASDGRSSEPCTVSVTVTPPVSFAGSWLLNPSSSSLAGCSLFSASFPAASLGIVHTGNALTVTPSGGGWPSGQTLTGTEEPPPAAAGTFTVRATLPNENKGGTCGTEVPEHSVSLAFNAAASPMTVSGTWRIVYTMTPACTQASCAQCNCVAQGAFTGIKQ